MTRALRAVRNAYDHPGGRRLARRHPMKHQTRALLVSLIGLGFALAALSAIPLSAADGSTDVLGPQTVSATVAMPVDIHAEVTAIDCDNSPGPYITLSGEVAVGGLAIHMIFPNNP